MSERKGERGKWRGQLVRGMAAERLGETQSEPNGISKKERPHTSASLASLCLP